MSRRKPYNVQVKLTEGQAETVLELIEDELEIDDDEWSEAERARLVSARKALKESLHRLDSRLGRLGIE